MYDRKICLKPLSQIKMLDLTLVKFMYKNWSEIFGKDDFHIMGSVYVT